MRSRSFISGLVLGVLAVGLFAAVPLIADERSQGSKLDYIYPKDFEGISLAVQDAPAPAAKFSRLTVKLYGGYDYMSAGDVNSGTRYYFDILDLYAAEGYGTITGGYKPLHGGVNVGGDVIYQLSPGFGIGLGFGYLRSSANSAATWTDVETVTITTEARLTGMPIRLGAFFSAPISKRINLITDVGVDYFLGVKLHGMQGLDWSETDWEHMILEASERSGLDIGFHGNLGFEYSLTPKIGLFIEAAAQYADLKNFESVTGTAETFEGTDTTEGKLYLGSQVAAGHSISTFTIVAPGDPLPGSYFREPRIDLSSLSIRAGFRIRI
jgi:Outer membrane protein beta-barrel domain